jgi:hydroxyethylthiazole kinase-like uncharacterized protein yjeF
MQPELLDPAEMQQADRLAVERGVDSFELMRRAGTAVAEAAAALAREGDVLVVVGPGNNGGDGFVAARLLADAGFHVRVVLSVPREALSGDAARAAGFYGGPVERLTAATDFSAGLVVDALFGAGLSRDLEGEAAAIVAAINASDRPVLAVDLPSGIDGRTGVVRGAAVRATRTISFFRLKPGHLLLPGRVHCGVTELADIGIPDAVLERIRPQSFHNGPGLWNGLLPRPGIADHKYARGHALVVSGPATATGAARLAAQGALRAGAGLVTVASPPDALLVNAAHLTAIMLRRFDGAGELSTLLADPRINVVVVGPGNGVGATTRDNVEAALASGAALVLDADALTGWGEERARLFGLIAGRAAPAVLTPHAGEFARLFAGDGAHIDQARRAAAESGAVIVLKGPDTLIAAPDGRIAINSNAPPELATAGSGDVLAGIVAGLLAGRMPAFEAAAAAVWLHGEAGTLLGRGLIAEDLPAALPAAFRRLPATF